MRLTKQDFRRNAGLPIKRLPHDPDAHVIMTPQLRELLAAKPCRFIDKRMIEGRR